MAVAQAPIGKVVEAGSLPPWGVGDLPAPPPYTLKNALRVTGAGAHDISTDTTEPIDTNFNCHFGVKSSEDCVR